VKSKEQLIYDLIFSEKNEYKIDIGEYITDIYKYEEFLNDMRRVLKKSKVSVVKSSVILDSKTAIWELKVRK
jgi:hypothetical protein